VPSAPILITGAAGFVGVNLMRGLAARGHSVAGLTRRAPDAATLAYLAPFGDRISWHLGDITAEAEFRALVARLEPSAIVHAAAITPTDAVEREATELVVDTNLVTTLRVLEVVRTLGVPRLLFASSTGVYLGSGGGGLRSEQECLQPPGLYAACKLASEALVSNYGRIHGLSACSLRIGTVYGPLERPSGSRAGLSLVGRLLPWAAGGGHLRVHGSHIGRDLIHADDVAEAVATLLQQPQLSHDCYNLGSDRMDPLSAVLGAFAELSGATWSAAPAAEAELKLGPAQQRDGLDLSRWDAAGGWRPRIGLARGLAHTLRWFRIGDDLQGLERFARETVG